MLGSDARWVPGFEGRYSVTDRGDVYSYLNGRWGLLSEPKKVAGTVATTGYRIVTLWRDRKSTQFGVHRLVLLTFRGEPDQGKTMAAHLNGQRLDNRLENLVWASAAENSRHMLLHGTQSKGSHRPLAKVNEDQASEIRRRWRQGESCTLLGREFGISKSAALKIGKGQTWRHVA